MQPRKHQHMMVQQKSHLNVSLATNIEHNLHYYRKNYQENSKYQIL